MATANYRYLLNSAIPHQRWSIYCIRFEQKIKMLLERPSHLMSKRIMDKRDSDAPLEMHNSFVSIHKCIVLDLEDFDILTESNLDGDLAERLERSSNPKALSSRPVAF